ncbi:SPFH domain-containing protein [Pseudomaricurvus alkylphenolicus]|jgi:regulator of protease activity HflC (stomatin/prohibitin superfamily)|uniref:SPFH domain-containing protein n=1 Tax=Pseudomaricurvus alkylphenolicus TaxID=1306991 RepID=UPI001423B89A|nr:SPFH domain-containing protein [Pseudomaricurvus alkylphenolicus]NIB39151.1 SPFH domain-containing protein [Pseudomaricurvus alkylphenolicus]
MIREKEAATFDGYVALLVLAILEIAAIAATINAITTPSLAIVGFVLLTLLVTFLWVGFFMVAPNEGKILQLFGNYVGTEHKTGLRWANPLYKKTGISLRVRNFESGKLKVNDARGNPIEIAAVIVWKVVDSAEAFFEVDDYESFVTIQSEAALRNLASKIPYENHKPNELSLRADPVQIADMIKREVQERLEKAGVLVIEARISHLAYSPEIAQSMLRKQQAGAVLAARRLIVQGAVEMVSDALSTLTDKHNFELDDERKASMVSNLLVVICSEQQAQPVVNTGSLY